VQRRTTRQRELSGRTGGRLDPGCGGGKRLPQQWQRLRSGCQRVEAWGAADGGKGGRGTEARRRGRYFDRRRDGGVGWPAMPAGELNVPCSVSEIGFGRAQGHLQMGRGWI
jgi:hypothetical protein